MAFSFLPIAAVATTPESGKPEVHGIPCETFTTLGENFAKPSPGWRLVAAFEEMQWKVRWANIVQQDDRFMIEYSTPQIRRKKIDDKLAQRISARLAEDVAHRDFDAETDEIYVDAPWYFYSADGKTCAATDVFRRTELAYQWQMVFQALISDRPSRQAIARSWLNRIEQKPETTQTD